MISYLITPMALQIIQSVACQPTSESTSICVQIKGKDHPASLVCTGNRSYTWDSRKYY